MTTLVLLQILYDTAQFLSSAAQVLPLFILAASYMADKKKSGDAAQALPLLLRTMGYLWIAGPIAIIATFALVPANLAAHGYSWQIPGLSHPALLPYTAATGLWLCALPLIFLAQGSLGKKRIVLPLVCLALLFFAQNAVLVWPFAGLPEGLSRADALIAVLKNAEHTFFFSLFPCGLTLLGLLLWTKKAAGLSENKAVRKVLAATAAIGAFPKVISDLGTLTGYFFREGHMPPPLVLLALHTGAILAIILCLAGIFFAEKTQPFLLRLTAGLVLAYCLLPAIQILCQ
ncbi:MAG: hypothetical protein IJU76_09670 [Desulfovibrionaceae bacterium]|nr:hypothetical protein [Desulfovibrionaceae bacterium]